VIQKALNKAFAPEFLNRIDDVVIFNNLSKEHLHKIIDIELQGLFDRMKRLGLSCKISPAAKDFLAEKGYDQKFGARPLKDQYKNTWRIRWLRRSLIPKPRKVILLPLDTIRKRTKFRSKSSSTESFNC
jgi:hypothetical protein